MPRGRRAAAAAGGAGVSALVALDPNDNSGLFLASDDEDLDESYMAAAAAPGGGRKSSVGSSKRHFLSASDDEDADESYMAPLGLRDADSDEEENAAVENSQQNSANAATKKSARRSVGRKSIGGRGAAANNKKKGGTKSRRRRSSARFLRLSGRFDADGDDGGANSSPAPLDRENLGEVYRQAIRMNAENKINAGNSWGLKLIENMDKLVHGDDGGGAAGSGAGGGGATGVNFTKASCTLDASVKIYGYRVDDVHLTSYKVLHNLNRTDAGGGKKGRDADGEDGHGGGMDDDDSDADGAGGRTRRQKRGGGTADTLESNLANINMSKLDSAPDIDPLFRKMSKAFDEGGAKGLLLNNLGVARDGCRIEFDSKEDTVTENVVAPSPSANTNDEEGDEEEEAMETIDEELPLDAADKDEEAEEPSTGDNREEGMIDITGLVTKLKEVLNGSSLESLPFVPQLESLRADFAALEADGFADDGKKGRRPPSRPARYGVTDEEEKEAERSIHMEAIERSHRSTANVSFAGGLGGAGDQDDDADDDNGPIMFGDDDDFGGGGDDDFDDDDDAVFTNFLAMDTNAEKYSAVEFHGQGDGAGGSHGVLPTTAMRTRTTTTALLDAICSSDALIAGGEFEYFDSDTLDKITKGNMWAGSEHWKKTDKIQSKKQKVAAATKKPSARKKRTSKKERAFVDLTCSSVSCLDTLINDKPKPKGKSKNDPLLLSKAVLSKQENSDNLLPPDAGVGIEQLSKLFMRPDAAVHPKKASANGPSLDLPRKSVGFLDMGPTIFDDGDDGSFGGCDDDGPGFQLADDDSESFVVEELEGVRKVNKVNIGYATVAKKVDVKRLKKDLWNNLETKTAAKTEEKTTDNDAEEDGDNSVDKDNEEDDGPAEEKVEEKEGTVSFQDTVNALAASQGQSEVTLPFYFICVLHLCNEKGLYLDQPGGDLTDFVISRDDGSAPTFGTMPESTETGKPRRQRGGAKKSYEEEAGGDKESDEEIMSEEED